MVACPQSKSRAADFAQLKPNEVRAGEYKAFMEVPAFGRPFTFAGLGPSSRIVSNSEFQPADDKAHQHRRQDRLRNFAKESVAAVSSSRQRPEDKNAVVAYCQPYTMPDLGPKGLMTLKFSGQPVPGLLSWNDFLNRRKFRGQTSRNL